jgi:hypothetical protein
MHYRRLRAIFKIELEVVRPMRRKSVGLPFTEDICEVVIFLRDAVEVNGSL